MNRHEFYRSKAWESLTNTLKMERVNEDGQIICAVCGQPIIKMYDCIAHHKIHLTEDNVNDANISLNPDNIDLVHHGCHNKLHNRTGYERRHVYLVYGSPLAGKSSYVKENRTPGDLIVDIDRIWDCISDEGYMKPTSLKSVAFAIRDTLMESVKQRRGTWNTAYIIGGFPLISDRERIQKEAGAELIFIDTPKEECLKRLEGLDDGRDPEAWRGYIEEWWRLYR